MLSGNETKSGGKREPGTEVRKDEPGYITVVAIVVNVRCLNHNM